MRTCTITLSIVVHAIAVCAAFIAPLLATDELPSPRTATEFIQVVQLPEPPPPAPRASTRANVAPPPRSAAPLEAPNGIAPEPPIELPDERVAKDNGVVAFGTFALADEPPPPSPPSSPSPISRVGGNIRQPQKVFDAAPIYPPIALAARKEGVVILEVVIAEDGSVRDARVLRSVPLLDAAALEAVRQWRFTPTLLNGQPVAVVMTVTVAFQLR